MVMECWAILAVLAMLLYLYLSRGRVGMAIAVAPLLLLPLFHLAGGPISRFAMAHWFQYLPDVLLRIAVESQGMELSNALFGSLVQIAVDVVALVVSCSLFGAIAHGMERKGARNGYLVLCIGFTVALAWVLIYNTIFPPAVL